MQHLARMKDPHLPPGHLSVEHYLTASESLDHVWNAACQAGDAAGGDEASRLQALLAPLAPPAQDGQQLLQHLEQHVRMLPTGMDSIDRLLDGGLREGQLSEVCGPSGSGRTQLALSAALTTAVRGEPVVFLDTCNSFSAARLQQLHAAVTAQQQQAPGSRLTLEAALALITVVRPHSIFALLSSLDSLSAHIARMTDPSHTPRLLVVDSLSALVSPILGGQQHTQGTTLMVALAQMLKQMAVRYHMAVLVTNHMTAAGGAAGVARPALGEQWRHQPSVRLQLAVDASGARSAELAVASVGRKAGRVPVEML